jgi:hypothetical protein
MFGDDSSTSTSSSMNASANTDTAPNFGSFLNLVEQKNNSTNNQTKRDIPKLEYY